MNLHVLAKQRAHVVISKTERTTKKLVKELKDGNK